MSQRTAESNKAIALAWKKEQAYVKEGKGTRDWTKEQQNDIIKRGKAYDDSGRAFEGQHMRSAEAYPESQGDTNNIQFLTREEHLAVHGGKWTNPTNGYYDPIAKKTMSFGTGPIIPCKTKNLSEPLFSIEKENKQKHLKSLKNLSLADYRKGIRAVREKESTGRKGYGAALAAEAVRGKDTAKSR